MNTAPHTALYLRKAENTEWNVLHLYEHLLIVSFEAELEARGYSRVSCGWLSGETFYEVLFLDAGFYDKRLKALFDEFMTRKEPRVHYDLLDNQLEVIEAEARSLCINLNKEALKKELHTLDKEPLVNFENTTDIENIPLKKTPEDTLLRFKKSARKFKTFTVITGLPDGTPEENAVFLRLAPLLYQIVTLVISRKGGYMDDCSETAWYNVKHHSLLESMTYSIKRSVFSPKQLKTELEDALRAYDPLNDTAALALYAKTFETMSTWNTFPVDFYRRTGMLVSRKAIASLLTPERIRDVLKRVTINIEG